MCWFDHYFFGDRRWVLPQALLLLLLVCIVDLLLPDPCRLTRPLHHLRRVKSTYGGDYWGEVEVEVGRDQDWGQPWHNTGTKRQAGQGGGEHPPLQGGFL